MSQFTIGNADSDGAVFAVPGDQPGTPASFELDAAGNAESYDRYVHINNGFDVDVDVTIKGSHYQDAVMDNAASDGATETVSAGGIDFFDGSTNHSYIELEVDPLADPTSGELAVTFQKREA
jgi:hypothetical protein